MTTRASDGDPRLYREEIVSLRTSALHRLVVAGLAVGFLWYSYVSVVLEVPSFRPWSGPAMLVLSSLLAYWMNDRCGFDPAAYTCVVGLALSAALAAWTYADSSILVFLALPVGIVGLLIGSTAGFLSATAVILSVSAGSLAAPALLPAHVAWRTSALVAFTAILSWLAMYPLRTTLSWAWSGYQRAQQQTEEMRDQRGRLRQTIKDLNAAYLRLETMAAELDRARKAANEARRLKAEFAANVSHELRTPLNMIIGYSEMMTMAPDSYGESLPAVYAADVQAIYSNARHLAALVDDILDLSQIEVGRMGLFKEPTSLVDVIMEAHTAVAHMFEVKGLAFHMDVPKDPPEIEVDRTRIRQVLINLLSNAVRFTEAGGITVAAETGRREVTVSVADTGIGMAEEDMGKAFEEFRQVDGSIRRRYGGSGLGLAISKKFVELHLGRMWVSSELGVGSTFYFTLPWHPEFGIAQLPARWETWGRPSGCSERARTVLLLEERSEVAGFFQRYLDAYRVIPVAELGQVPSVRAREPVDALVIAVEPGDTGWHVVQRARRTVPSLPIIACSLDGGSKAGDPLNAADYLVKPVSRRQLMAALEKLGDRVEHLLVVDDDAEVVRLLARMVRQANRKYRVIRAYDGDQALKVLQQRQVDAVVLDLMMPKVDGRSVLEQMRADERLSQIPVIIVTAQDREEQAVTATLLAITSGDGFTIGELMRHVKATLDGLHVPPPPHNATMPPVASPE